MSVVQAQVKADGTPATPVELFEAPADCTVNIFCVNKTTVARAAFVEVRLQGASQDASQLLVPGTLVPAVNRIVEGPVDLKTGDTVYVYAAHADQVFQLYGETL